MRDEILHKIITDEYLFGVFIENVGIVECLTPMQKLTYKKVLAYNKEHKKVLTLAEADTLFERVINTNDLGSDFTFETVLDEIKREKLKYWILNVATDIEDHKVNYAKVFKELGRLKDKLEVRVPKGIEAGAQVASIIELETSKIKTDTMRSLINALDRALFGGFHKGELAFMITPPGRGKSTFLVNLFYGFLMQNRCTLFLSNELRTEVVLARLYRRIMQMERKDFSIENKAKIVKHLKKFFNYVKGSGVVHYVPVNQWGPEDLKSWALAWEKQYGRKIDCIVIDYFDRLKKPWGEGERFKQRALVDTLRDFAVDQDLFIATATQTNRAGLSAPLVTEEHTGEAFAKVESADVILSLSQSAQEKSEQRARVTVLKNREFGGAGTIVDVKTIWEELTVTDFEFVE